MKEEVRRYFIRFRHGRNIKTMRIIRLFLFATLLVTSFACKAGSEITEENAIKQGEAVVNLSIASHSGLTIDSLRCEILWPTLLDITNDGTWRVMLPVTFENESVSVPMETLYRDGIGMEIKDLHNNILARVTFGLHQSKPLNLTLHFDKENRLVDVSHSGGTGNVDYTGQYDKIRMNFGSTSLTNKEDWENPQRFLEWQLESELPRNIREAFSHVDISDVEKNWMTQNLTLLYSATRILPYEKRAKTWGRDFVGVDTSAITQPPLEFYDFMNKMDYSPVILNDFTNSLRFVCNNILTELPVGIKPIGETPIDEWQSDVKTRLSGIIDNPSQLLLDLLAATSYFNQIQYDNRQLSPIQVSNINHFYSDSDLGKIILSRNENPYPNIMYPNPMINIEWID